MSAVKVSKEVLGFVKDLTTINDSIIFENTEDKIIVKRANPPMTIAYFLSVPKSELSFEGEKLAFYNYPEFYSLVNAVDGAEIEQEENKLSIKTKNSKIKYLVSDPETLKKGPKKMPFENPTAAIKLTAETLKEIRKMIGLLDSKKASLSVTGKVAILKVYNSSHDNSFEKTIEMETATSEDFNILFTSEIFSLIPENEYLIGIKKKEGIIQFKYITTKAIELEIFTAESEE